MTRRGLQDQVVEGEQGWGNARSSFACLFCRAAVSGQKFFTVLSLHISNIYAKKKSAKKIIWTVRAIMIDLAMIALSCHVAFFFTLLQRRHV